MASEKTHLSREDVCSILDTSAKAGVRELTFAGLHVVFGRPAEQQVAGYPFVPQIPAPSLSGKALSDADHAAQAKRSLEEDEVRLREDQLAHALVEDPVLYEKLVQEGMTNDVDTADEDPDLD